jgi:hypothetical protein
MNAEQDNFQALRKLMTLKRHEQPPPGYFDQLPGRIMAKINTPVETQGFIEQLLTRYILRPAFAFTMGLAVCGMFATGITYSLKANPGMMSAQPHVEPWELASSGASTQPIALHVSGFDAFSGTNQDIETRPSLFNNLTPRAVPASFSIGR